MWRFNNELPGDPNKSRSLIQSRDLSFLQAAREEKLNQLLASKTKQNKQLDK